MKPATQCLFSVLVVMSGLIDAVLRAESLKARPALADDCVALKPGNARISDGIGIVFGADLPRKIVEEAVGHWSRCHGYESDFPHFLVGEEGRQTVSVKLSTSYNRQSRCGSFVGRTIVLYAFAVDSNGRLHSCGSRADGLAHELGHLLGLLDTPLDARCFDHAMSPVDVTDRNRRDVQPEECRAVGERWLTAAELAEQKTVLLAANP